MSRHRPEDKIYVPKDFYNAKYVYVKVENPKNLSPNCVGPYEIINRPSNTTNTIRVGHDKDGIPRLQNHQWNNCQTAYLCPYADIHRSRGPGRPRTSEMQLRKNFNMVEEETANNNKINNNCEKRAKKSDATMETDNHATFQRERLQPNTSTCP